MGTYYLYLQKLLRKHVGIISGALCLLCFLEGCRNATPTQSIGTAYQSAATQAVASGEPGGIPNLGTTCYMNTALQVLAAFYANMVDAKRSGLTEEGKKLASVGKEIITKINAGKNVSEEATKEFFNVLAASLKLRGLHLKIDEQHDASLLMQNLFDILEFPLAKIAYTASDPAGRYPKETSEDTFNILLLSPRLEDDVTIVPMEIDMQACFPYPVVEKIPNYCWGGDEGGGIKSPAERKCLLMHPGKLAGGILPIMISRASAFAGSVQKIFTKINNASHIILKKEAMLGVGKDIPCDLLGFIVHIGISYKSGHYIAYIKRGTSWYYADDSRINKVTMEEVEKAAKDGYLYFYKLGQ